MGWPKGKKRGPKKKALENEAHEPKAIQHQNGFRHLFDGDYEYLYDEVCSRAKNNVRTPLQELIAIVKRAVEINQLKDDRRKKDEKNTFNS